MFYDFIDRLRDLGDDLRFGGARTRLRAFTVIITVVALLGGGGTFGYSMITKLKRASSSTNTTTNASGQLNLWYAGTPMKGTADAFTAWIKSTRPDLKVVAKNMKTEGEIISAVAALKKGESPDIVLGSTTLAQRLNEQHALIAPVLETGYEKRLDVKLRELLSSQGVLYAVPFAYESYVAIYNPNLVKQPPKTIWELAQQPRKKLQALMCIDGDGYGAQMLFSALGSRPEAKGGKLTATGLDDKATLDNLEKFMKTAGKGAVNYNCTSYFSNEIPFGIIDPANISILKPGSYKIFQLPGTNSGAPWSYFNAMVPRTAIVNHQRELALELVKWFGTPNAQKALAEDTHRVPFISEASKMVEDNITKQVISEHERDIEPLDRLTQVQDPNRYRYLLDSVLRAVGTGTAPSEAAKNAAAEITKLFDTPGKR